MPVYRRKKRDGTYDETYTVSFVYRKIRVCENTQLRSKAEAKKWETNKRRALAEEVASQRLTRRPKNLTIKQAMARYAEEQASLTPSWKNQKYVAEKLCKEIGEHLPLHELSTAHLKQLVARKVRSGLAPATVVRELALLRAMYNMARDVWEYPGLRPIAWKKVRPEIPDTEIEIPSLDKVRELVEAATPRLSLVIMFAVMTGLRRHEIKKLTLDMYDRERKQIRFSGKGSKTVNHPLSGPAMATIAASLQEMQARSQKTSTNNSAQISQVSSTQPAQSLKLFDMTNFVREWNVAREAVGLPNTRFHDLRHVFATLVKANTTDPLKLMTAMRHSDVDTSLIYVHADKSEMFPLLESVAEALQKTSPTPSKPSLPWNAPEPEKQLTDE